MPFELEDQSWFPAWMRQQQMDYLSFLALHFHLYQPALPVLQILLSQQPTTEWTDCCSGAGGPAFYLAAKSDFKEKLLMTDKHIPAPKSIPKNVNAEWKALDVLTDAIDGRGLVSMFNAFHHFDDSSQQQIIEKIARQRRPLLIVEITRPTFINLVMVTIAGTIGQILLAPFVAPFSWKRLCFTYLLPINLITVTWDGWMSVWYAMPARRFETIVKTGSANNFRFQFQQAGPWWRKLAILSGQPIA